MTGEVIAIVPPKNSASAMDGVRELPEPYARTLKGEGAMVMSWDLYEDRGQIQVGITLTRHDVNGITHMVDGAMIPATPTFTVSHMLVQRFVDNDEEQETLSGVFADLNLVPPGEMAIITVIEEQKALVQNALSRFIEPGKALDGIVEEIYNLISIDVTIELFMNRNGPEPDFPGK